MIDRQHVPPSHDPGGDGESSSSRNAPDRRSAAASRESGAGAYASVGLQFAIAIILFLFLGQWLDSRFGTTPVFVILGVFIGAAAAFYNMYRKLMAQHRDEGKNR